jgi:hypothetical protein
VYGNMTSASAQENNLSSAYPNLGLTIVLHPLSPLAQLPALTISLCLGVPVKRRRREMRTRRGEQLLWYRVGNAEYRGRVPEREKHTVREGKDTRTSSHDECDSARPDLKAHDHIAFAWPAASWEGSRVLAIVCRLRGGMELIQQDTRRRRL